MVRVAYNNHFLASRPYPQVSRNLPGNPSSRSLDRLWPPLALQAMVVPALSVLAV